MGFYTSAYTGAQIDTKLGYVDQDVKVAASPTFVSLFLNNSAGTVPLRLYVTGGAIAEHTYTNIAGLQIDSYQSAAGSPYTKTSDIVANADSGAEAEMRFFTTAAGSAPSLAMTLDSSGNVNLPQLTASRVLTLDGSKNIVSSYTLDQNLSTTSNVDFGNIAASGTINTTGNTDRYFDMAVNPGNSGKCDIRLFGSRNVDENLARIYVYNDYNNTNDSVAGITFDRIDYNDQADIVFLTQANGLTISEKMRITGAGLVKISGLTASELMGTDSSKNLVSLCEYNVSGTQNLIFGDDSPSLSGGTYNTGFGVAVFQALTSGGDNTAIGTNSCAAITDDIENTAIGKNSFRYILDSYNTAIGFDAGRYYGSGYNALTSGTYHTLLGRNTRPSANGTASEIVIGNSAYGNGSDTATLGNTSCTAWYMGSTLMVNQAVTSTSSPTFASGTTIQTDQNSGTDFSIRNDTDNTGAASLIKVMYGNATARISMAQFSPSYTSATLYEASKGCIYSSGTSEGINIFTSNAKPLTLGTNSIARMTINSSGTITSTTSTENTLLLESTGDDANLSLTAEDGYYSRIYFADDSDGDIGGIYYNHANNSMAFRVNNTIRMTINSSGDYGIGTTDIETWNGYIALEGAGGALAFATSGDGYRLLSNAYNDGSYKRKAAGYACMISTTSHAFTFYTAATSTADSTISWSEKIKIDYTGIGFFGTTPAAQPAHIADADGTLADITTKFNTLLAQHATLGLQAAS